DRPARHGDDPQLAAQDDAPRRRPRRASHRRLRSRDRGALHGGGVRLPRRAGRARRGPRRPDPVRAERDPGGVSERRLGRRRRRTDARARSRRLMVAVTLPQLSLSMEDGKVVRWLVADGDRVSAGQPVVEIETDKATIEVEAPAEGVIRLVAEEGQILAVETTLAEIGAGDEEELAPVVQLPAPTPAAAAAEAAPAPARSDGRGHIASPAARRLAADRGLDLAGIRGSGPGGRIIARDLEQIEAPAAPADGLGEAVI